MNKLNLKIEDSISELRYFLRHFEVRTKRWKIFFRGKSFEFDGFRAFTQDDDISSVDWKASLRSDNLLVRQYKEEEDKKLIFALDIGEHMVFGTTEKLKCEYAAEIVLSLVSVITMLNDKVGLILFNDKVAKYFPPQRGTRNFNIYLDFLSDPQSYSGGSDIGNAIDFLIETQGSSVSAVILVSDFLNFNNKASHYLQILTSKFETIAFIVKDPIDLSMPNVSGEFFIQDPKSGEQILVNPQIAKTSYDSFVNKKQEFLHESFKEANVDYIDFVTDKPFASDLINFLQERLKRR